MTREEMKMRKECYEKAELEVVFFQTEDVIMASPGDVPQIAGDNPNGETPIV